MGKCIQREVDADGAFMRVFYGCLQLVEREVSGCGAHTEVVAGEVDRVRAVEYRGAQLVGTSGRRQQLGSVCLFFHVYDHFLFS